MSTQVLFKKGNQVDLPSSGAQQDAFYLTEDTHRLYIGTKTGGTVLLNSSVAFYANETALNEATGTQFKPVEGDLAFVSDKNALAIYKNNAWQQINSQAAVKQIAETALANAAAAQKTADDAASAAAAAGTAASEAQDTANTAVANAATAQAAAEGAQGTANTAVTNAATAQAAAEAAQSTANTANTVAERAEGKADANATEITTIKLNYATTAQVTAAINTAKSEIVGTAEDAATADTIKGAKKYTDVTKAAVIGTSADAKTADTVYGAKKYADEAVAAVSSDLDTVKNTYATKSKVETDVDNAKAAVIGTSADAKTADTVYGAKKYADEAAAAVIGTSADGKTADTIYGVKKYADDKVSAVDTKITTLAGQIGNIENIMNFRGVYSSTSDITDPVNGDVIIVDGVEYVYISDTNTWEAFGAATATEDRFEGIEEDIENIQKAAEDLTDRVDALDTTTTGRVALVEAAVATNASAIETEKGRINTLTDTTIPAIEAKIGTVAADTNLAKMITDEVARATGVEDGLNTRLVALEGTTIPGMQTAHNALAERVTALDAAQTGKVAVIESNISALNNKIGTVAEGTNLAKMITDEVTRATTEEADIRADFAAADGELRTEFNNRLTWGSFN